MGTGPGGSGAGVLLSGLGLSNRGSRGERKSRGKEHDESCWFVLRTDGVTEKQIDVCLWNERIVLHWSFRSQPTQEET